MHVDSEMTDCAVQVEYLPSQQAIWPKMYKMFKIPVHLQLCFFTTPKMDLALRFSMFEQTPVLVSLLLQ